MSSTSDLSSSPALLSLCSGVGGGVVSQTYFQIHFGITDEDGNNQDKRKADNINSNVVSVLQAGAFFGALASAPLSGVCRPGFATARRCIPSLRAASAASVHQSDAQWDTVMRMPIRVCF